MFDPPPSSPAPKPPPTLLHRIGRFIGVSFIASIAVPCLGWWLLPGWDLAQPPMPDEPNDTILAFGVWGLIFAIATLDLVRGNRKRAARPPDPSTNPPPF